MVLDEAIKHAEEVTVENLEKTKGRNVSDPIAISCGECADEYRQFAEWLKELKELRERTRWIPVSERLPPLLGSYKISDDVLITNEFEIYIGYLVERKGKIFWHYYGSDIEVGIKDDDNDVTAWMSLPGAISTKGW